MNKSIQAPIQHAIQINHSINSNLACFFFLTPVFITENQEKFFIYLFISVTAGVLLCLLLVIGRLLIQKRQLKKADKKEQSMNTTGEMTIPNGFPDDISEIDGDIDITTSSPVPCVSRNEVCIIKYCVLYVLVFCAMQ